MKEKTKKPLKIFLANSVYLDKVENKYRGNNNNCQYTILVKTKSKKEVARILAGKYRDDESRVNSVYSHLLNFHDIHEAPEKFGFKGEHIPSEIVKKEDVIYFNPAHTKTGFYDIWVEYTPYEKP